MLRPFLAVVAIVVAIRPSAVASEGELYLSPHLEPLRPFIGKTWKGSSVDSSGVTKTYDVSRWERALNGKAVRILHSLNEGEYGGETILMWDEEQGALTFFYFTTAGFYTRGTITFKDSLFVAHEQVSGKAGGITEVRSTGRLRPDGSFHSRSEYLRNGEWAAGHEFNYVEDPDAEVVFR